MQMRQSATPRMCRLQSLCSPLEAVLWPGDVLYFPAGWSHHTEAAHVQPELFAYDAEGQGHLTSASFSLGFRTDGQYLL